MAKASDSDASTAVTGPRSTTWYRTRASSRMSVQRNAALAHLPNTSWADNDSENDAEGSSDTRTAPHTATYTAARNDACALPLQSKRRSATTRHVEVPASPAPSLFRPLFECALFAAACCAVLVRIMRSVSNVQEKVVEVGVLCIACLACFATHLRTACTIYATRSNYLRKTDPSDPLYALLLPLVASAQLLDVAIPGQDGALAPPRMMLGQKGAWRVERIDVPVDRLVGHGALLDVHVICAAILCIHVFSSSCMRVYRAKRSITMQEMRSSQAFMCFHGFALAISALLTGVQMVCQASGYGRFCLSSTPKWATFTTAMLYQSQLYITTRVARQNCTLGELAIVCAIGTAMFSEAIIVTVARLVPFYTRFYFREPSAIVFSQLALVVGMLLIGLLMSPLLVLSRNLAQRPTHRLRWPHKRNLHRRLLALAFFVLSTSMVLGVFGPWLAWQLRKRSAWLYFARFMLQGPTWWSRIALLGYWGVLCNIALLSIQLMVNRMWQYATVGDQVKAPKRSAVHGAAPTAVPLRTAPTATERASTLAATQFAERTKEQVDEEGTSLGPRVAVSVNGRRKFFHALAVLLFVPGIAWDPAFMHLAFSSAFALFVLCEYLRYCAVYPFGATLHFFLSQFLDNKDCGLVILSHAYLLSGCAAGVWLECQSRIAQQLGVLVLGVGDSVASIVGRQYGRIHWPLSQKTVEGTLGFVTSMMTSMFVLRMFRLVEAFDVGAFMAISTLLAVMEGVSEQNDNLVLPLTGVFLTSMIPLSR